MREPESGSEDRGGEADFLAKSFGVLGGSVLIHVVQIVAGAIIARWLGPREMGMWLILLMIPSYAEILGRLHLDEAAVFVVGRGAYRVGEVAFALGVVSLASAGILIGAFAAAREWLFATFLRDLADARVYAYWMVGYVPVSFLALNYNYLLLADEDVAGYNAVRFVTLLVPWAVGALLVTALGLGLAGLVASYIASGMFAVAYGFRRVHRRHRLRFHASTSMVRLLGSFGGKLYLLSLFSYLNTYVSGVIALLYLPVEQVGFYRIAQNTALLVGRLPEAVATVLYPRVARIGEDAGRARQLTARSVRLSMAALLVAMTIGVALARPIVLALYGRAFEPTVLLVWVLLPGTVLLVGTALVRQHFSGRGRIGVTVAITAVPMALQVALLAAAIPRFGVVGAALGTSFSYLVASIIHVMAFRWIEGVPARQLLVVNREDLALTIGWARAGLGALLRSASR